MTEYFVRDPFGQPIRVGDIIAGAAASDQLPIFGPVLTIGNTAVTVGRLAQGDDGEYLMTGDEERVPLGRLVLVRPRAEARLCSCTCLLTPHPLARPHADDCPALNPATRAACCTPGAGR